jgi:4-hydroxy-3-methylbut-2-en-1-yl diphosphate reductase
MEIQIARHSGLCYGVKRALRLALETRAQRSGPVLTLGDLIHNPQVIRNLEQQGIQTAREIDDVEKGTVIIRSHGVSPDVYRRLVDKDIPIVDATCPIVKRIQEKVEELASQGCEVVIVGNARHPETLGLIGYSRGRGVVIESEDQARALPQRKRRAVLAQSTQDIHLLKAVVNVLVERTRELIVHNTVCQSTQTRQRATLDLAARVDVLFIIGGRSSSNTNKLYSMSHRIQPRTFFIENAGQILPEMLTGVDIVGLSGGASTPPEAIQEAAETITKSVNNQIHREKMVQ